MSAKVHPAIVIMLGILMAIFTLTAVVCLTGEESGFHATWDFQHRFATDNAQGATANAVEHIADQYPAASASPWVVATLLCWLILSIERTRAAILFAKP